MDIFCANSVLYFCAIGTGETASSDQVQEMHSFIRSFIAQKYSTELAQKISILYGGSVKPNNAKEIKILKFD